MICGIFGDRGSGKTLFMTLLLKIDEEDKNHIITNYNVSFPHKKMTLEEICKLPEELSNATIGLDELHMAADSRRFMADSNKQLAVLVTQIRKRQCDLYYTSQRIMQIDKRIRSHTDRVIVIEKVGKHKFYWIYRARRGVIIKEGVIDGREIYDMYDTNEIVRFDGKGDNDG